MDAQYDLVQAIKLIKPDAEFAVSDMVITWLDEKQTQPTDEEIKKGLIKYKAKVLSDEAIIAATKQSAQAKLAALGLTADEIAAIGN